MQLYPHCNLNDLPVVIEETWAESFGLLINPKKNQASVIGRSRLRSKINWNTVLAILYLEVKISFCDNVRNLGLIINSNMSWSTYINAISKRMHFSYHTLRRLQYFISHKIRIMLAQCLYLLILDYADVCYLDVTEELLLLNKLERLQHLAIRFVYGVRKYVSQFPVSSSAHIYIGERGAHSNDF